MSAQHTPGPWKLLPTEAGVSYLRIRGARLGARFKVANVLAPSHMPQDAMETEANARLIAAVPDYFDATAALMRDLSTMSGTSLAHIGHLRGSLLKLQAAHAKASESASLVRLGKSEGAGLTAADVDQRVPVVTPGAQEETPVSVDLGIHRLEHDSEAAFPARPHVGAPDESGNRTAGSAS